MFDHRNKPPGGMLHLLHNCHTSLLIRHVQVAQNRQQLNH